MEDKCASVGAPDDQRPHYVTLRLTDALPHSVMEAWHQDIERRVHLLSEMKGRSLESGEERHVVKRTLGRIDRCLDSGRGGCLLSDERAAGLVESVLWNGDGERYRLHAWSVMPNHVHALVTPLGPACVDDVIQEWKHESTRKVNQELRRVGGLWHPNVIDYEVKAPTEFVRLRSTIATNPTDVGLNEWPFAGEEPHPARELAAV